MALFNRRKKKQDLGLVSESDSYLIFKFINFDSNKGWEYLLFKFPKLKSVLVLKRQYHGLFQTSNIGISSIGSPDRSGINLYMDPFLTQVT